MRKLAAVAAVCGIGATLLFAQSKFTPMNVKTGLWQSTSTITVEGMGGATPQPRTSTQQGCLTRQELTTDPFSDMNKSEDGVSCKENLIRSSGSDAEVELSCTGSQISSRYHLTLHAVDQEHVTGTGQGTANIFGNSMKSSIKFQSHWLRAACPAHAE